VTPVSNIPRFKFPLLSSDDNSLQRQVCAGRRCGRACGFQTLRGRNCASSARGGVRSGCPQTLPELGLAEGMKVTVRALGTC